MSMKRYDKAKHMVGMVDWKILDDDVKMLTDILEKIPDKTLLKLRATRGSTTISTPSRQRQAFM